MMTYLSIGELAKQAGVPTSTIRFYERRGLLTPPRRNEANHRVYGPDQSELLRFIRAAQAMGFSLRDIELLIELRANGGNPCGEVRMVIEKRLSVLTAKLNEIKQATEALDQALNWCRAGEAQGRCGAMESLNVISVN